MRILAILLLLSSGAIAQNQSGAELYRFHCSTCHGLNATGNGPMAPILTVQPIDLTTLASENDGQFPRWRVISRIDGRDPLVAHGSDMPVFGPWFQGDEAVPIKTETGQPAFASQPIYDLVLYLESIQN